MFKILTELLLLPLRSGPQSDESFPLRRPLLSAREQALLLETDRQTEWMCGEKWAQHTHFYLPCVKCGATSDCITCLPNDSKTVSQLMKVFKNNKNKTKVTHENRKEGRQKFHQHWLPSHWNPCRSIIHWSGDRVTSLTPHITTICCGTSWISAVK